MTNNNRDPYVKSVTFTIMLLVSALVIVLGVIVAAAGTSASSTSLRFEVQSIRVDLTTTSVGLVVMVSGCVLLLGLWLFGRRDVVPFNQHGVLVPLERRLLRILVAPAVGLGVVGVVLLLLSGHR